MDYLALDVGGANLKAAHSGGGAWSVRFAVWKHPHKLAHRLRRLLRLAPGFDGLVVTMTAELCGCFTTKREGVGHVLDAVGAVAGAKPVWVWLTDGRLVDLEEARQQPLVCAASNWLALATFVAQQFPEGESLFIDTGSTTTDIVWLEGGLPRAQGLTDPHRLATGELVYVGVRRTGLAALGTEVQWRGRCYGLVAEAFAKTGDVFWLTGQVAEAGYWRGATQGESALRVDAARRVVRVIGGDLEMYTVADAVELAGCFAGLAAGRVAQGIARVCQGRLMPDRVVVSGSGDFLASQAADRVWPGVAQVRLAQAWGDEASCAGCAYALAQLALRGSVGSLG